MSHRSQPVANNRKGLKSVQKGIPHVEVGNVLKKKAGKRGGGTTSRRIRTISKSRGGKLDTSEGEEVIVANPEPERSSGLVS